MQKRLYDISWSDEKKCRGCNKQGGTEKHILYHCPCWKEIRSQIPQKLRKCSPPQMIAKSELFEHADSR